MTIVQEAARDSVILGEGNWQPRQFSFSIVCREGFMRESMQDALQDFGNVVAGVYPSLDLVGGEFARGHAILYVEPPEFDVDLKTDLTLMEGLRDRNWIVMSRSKGSQAVARLTELGANVSIVPFDVSRGDLANLARLAANGRRVFIDRFCCSGSAADAGLIKAAGLSADQTHLLKLLAEGFSNKEIALRQGCAENTVKMRVRSLLSKLGVANRTRAAVIAARAGMH